MTLQLARAGFTLGVELADDVAPLAGALRHFAVTAGSGTAPVRLRVVDATEPRFVVAGDVLELHAPPERIAVHTLQLVADLAFHRVLDAEGIVVLHAAVVSDGETTLALWGGSGAGKTTTAVALHESRGFSVLSNGTAMFRLVDGAPTFVGTAKGHVKLRATSVAASGSELATEFERSGRPGYEHKVEKSIASLADGSVLPPLPVTRFIMIRLIRALPGAEEHPVRRDRAGVELYEDAVRHLHGLTAVLLDAEGRRLTRLPVLVTPSLHARRAALLRALLDRATGVSGPLEDVVRLLGTTTG